MIHKMVCQTETTPCFKLTDHPSLNFQLGKNDESNQRDYFKLSYNLF